jgi:hypothetical protein
MNQSLSYELANVIPTVLASGLQASLCTIQQLAGGVDPRSGQPNLDNWVNVAGLVNLPAMLSVLSTLRPDGAGVKRQPDQFDITGIRHLFLGGNYKGQIDRTMQAIVDGNTYEIMSVEFDSQSTQTRLGIRFWEK